MNNFLKYPSIENSYNEKWIKTFLDCDIENIDYLITEKLHGSNIQLIFSPNEPMKIASRNHIVDGSFYKIGEIIDYYDFRWVQRIAEDGDVVIHLYGEYFGGNIQKGVDYGKERRIRFFDMRYNNKIVTQFEFLNFFSEANKEYWTVPILGVVQSLREALAYNSVFDSRENTIINNTAEGIVIKPLYRVIHNHNHEIFYIKVKTEQFKEKQRTKKEPREQHVFSEEVSLKHLDFLAYVNEERFQSVLSKHGEMTENKEIGSYIGYLMKDAIETFKKEEDFDETLYDKEELKYIFKAQREASDIVLKNFFATE